MPPVRIEAIRTAIVPVSEKSSWYFVQVVDRSGETGIGEATLNGWEAMLDAAAGKIRERLAGAEISNPAGVHDSFPDQTAGRVFTSMLSAVEQALWDVAARKSGKPLWAVASEGAVMRETKGMARIELVQQLLMEEIAKV